RTKGFRLLPDEWRLRNLGLIFIISASSISEEPAMEFQDVVGDEYSGGISCSSFIRVSSANFLLRNVTRCNDSSLILGSERGGELTVWTCSC
ncbi:unnamed protein product, partial [Brassica rapa subsp. narinosa]